MDRTQIFRLTSALAQLLILSGVVITAITYTIYQLSQGMFYTERMPGKADPPTFGTTARTAAMEQKSELARLDYFQNAARHPVTETVEAYVNFAEVGRTEETSASVISAISEIGRKEECRKNDECRPHCAVILLPARKVPGCHCSCWHQDQRRRGPHWMQVDLGKATIMTQIATRGRFDFAHEDQYVTLYKIRAKLNQTEAFTDERILAGNENTNEVVWRDLVPPLMARYLLLEVLKFKGGNMCLSMDLKGYTCE